MPPAEAMYVFINHERNCWSTTLFYRPCLNPKTAPTRDSQWMSGAICTLAVYTEMQQHFKESYEHETHQELGNSTIVLCLTSSCVHLPIFLKYLFRIRVNCKRTCEPVPPLLHCRRSPNHFGMEFTSNNLRLHVSKAGEIIATFRFARFHAAPKHGLRP